MRLRWYVSIGVICGLLASSLVPAASQATQPEHGCLEPWWYVRTAGFGFGELFLAVRGNSLTGTYAPTNSGTMGFITFVWDEATGRYAGTWSEPAASRSGVLSNIEMLDATCTSFEADWETRESGEWPAGVPLPAASGHVRWARPSTN